MKHQKIKETDLGRFSHHRKVAENVKVAGELYLCEHIQIPHAKSGQDTLGHS